MTTKISGEFLKMIDHWGHKLSKFKSSISKKSKKFAKGGLLLKNFLKTTKKKIVDLRKANLKRVNAYVRNFKKKFGPQFSAYKFSTDPSFIAKYHRLATANLDSYLQKLNSHADTLESQLAKLYKGPTLLKKSKLVWSKLLYKNRHKPAYDLTTNPDTQPSQNDFDNNIQHTPKSPVKIATNSIKDASLYSLQSFITRATGQMGKLGLSVVKGISALFLKNQKVKEYYKKLFAPKVTPADTGKLKKLIREFNHSGLDL